MFFYENTCFNQIPTNVKSCETELNTLKEKVRFVFNGILDRVALQDENLNNGISKFCDRYMKMVTEPRTLCQNRIASAFHNFAPKT